MIPGLSPGDDGGAATRGGWSLRGETGAVFSLNSR